MSISETEMHINLGRWTEGGLGKIIREASLIRDAGPRIKFLSDFFLGLEYKESTLIGDSSSTAEVFVVNLSEVDCFTFLDYIEAMRLSESFDSFLRNLQQVRYRNSIVSYEKRKHFLTDWAEYEPVSVDDITAQTGRGRTRSIVKIMNLKGDGTPLLAGVGAHQRTINYISAEDIDESVLQRLKTGDYAGIYSAMEGLDASHVGIIVRDGNTVFLRHASSDRRWRKVVDQDFQEYVSGRPGLIVLRPRG